MTLATATKASFSTTAAANAAMADPTATPASAGTAHARNTPVITAPLSR